MFDISSLQYNSEYPAFTIMLFTVLCSLTLGVLIAFTYEKTSSSPDRPDHFIQAMVLITIVAATIMQAIGDSVARGLGMLGALSIIRFRTTVRNPRNIVFMFSAIAAGIACGVFGFVIAAVGTIGFCLTAFLLRWSSFTNKAALAGSVRLEMNNDEQVQKAVERELKKHASKFELCRKKIYVSEKKANLMLCEYQLRMKSELSANDLLNGLGEIADARVLNIDFRNARLYNI